MEIRILGRLEVVADGEPVQLGGRQRQALLALLTVDPGQALTTDRLISELWTQAPPEGARRTVQAHMSHLRRALNRDEETITAAGRGYRLVIDHVDLDATPAVS
jgi:DNA-binding SARP family transcriptional activator